MSYHSFVPIIDFHPHFQNRVIVQIYCSFHLHRDCVHGQPKRSQKPSKLKTNEYLVKIFTVYFYLKPNFLLYRLFFFNDDKFIGND